ncbi:hypothetical protein LMQ14_25205 [Mycobacterium sp. Aquia_213]|nr:hypothetical protein LMQ14_25205 [Mycobacterium sp. Aquia_213]
MATEAKDAAVDGHAGPYKRAIRLGPLAPRLRHDGVLEALASALQLDEAERDHLFHLARQSGAVMSGRDGSIGERDSDRAADAATERR